ncbi:MAG: hypothetical protein ACTSV3_05475 [Candidatus Thorarchaeota archaeon]|nr:MAG: hypothetical protein DRP09_06525 [Candidatus Thorarchaeota archaeon]RLI59781.1 MAG: hypothetical protein DRO87_01855 [Candidatus Thorarchaeota archaeon]
MNILVFLLISLVVHSIPIPPSRRFLQFNYLIRWLPLRLVWGTVAWAVICLMMVATLPWATLNLILSMGVLMVFTSGFRLGTIDDFRLSMRAPFTAIGIVIIIVVPAFSGVVSWTSDVSNAQYFDAMITETDEPLFSNPIPDNMVRLVTQEYAVYTAYQHISEFGSNAVVAAAHITTVNDTLVWICTIISTNVLAQNYVIGFVVIDANDPQSVTPYSITNTTIPVGEGLFWDRNIQFGNYLTDMTSSYEYAYPTFDPSGGLVYVQTRTPIGFDFIERAIGPRVYAENGTVYEYASIEETPDWITQAYSEEWLEREISRWGGYRRGDGFDLFAGGFLWMVQPSNDRLEIHEDTRYIINPDSGRVEAMITVNPVTNTRALAGVFRATQEGVIYHDMSSYDFISGDAAIANVVADIPAPAGGRVVGAMPLLYPVQINSTFVKWTWYAPIFWMDGSYDDDGYYHISNMNLHALAMVDAGNADLFTWKALGGSLSGGDLVYAVRSDYIALFGGEIEQQAPETFNLTATVDAKESYQQNGETHIVLRTSNSTYRYIEGIPSWMNSTSWYTLLFDIGIGDSFTATIHEVDGVYRIVAIIKN